ncbi:MAG: hypothetical protein J0H01_37850 [Rhizobiales bacterium]|nr:hypothetical protein [Hyphomicrobiales bacterium]
MSRINKTFGLLIAAGLALVGAALPHPAKAQTAPEISRVAGGPPSSAIFIGNSFFYYNNGIGGHVTQLVAAGDPGTRFRNTLVTISGSGADWHDVASYFRPNAIARYSFDAGNNIVFNRFNKLFDIAIVMDCSQCPIHPELGAVFTDYARRNSETLRQNGAEPVFFMSWAYADKPDMTAQLAEAYTRAGNANRALVIPAGLAFARAIAQRPDINLYIADKRHPSLAGTYLAAATIYAALFNRSPAGFAYTAGLDPAVAAFLQTIAWETVQAYYRKGA